MSEKIEEQFQIKKNKPSDINEHFDTLREYAGRCDHITEMGVAECVSTWALLAGYPKKYVGYDCYKRPFEYPRHCAREIGMEFEFHIADTSDPTLDIEETDLLFIDTYHIYDHLKKEFELHASKARKYIILHDTTTFGEVGDVTEYPTMNEPADRKHPTGLWLAIEEFLDEHCDEWELTERYTNNNGLTVLTRK